MSESWFALKSTPPRMPRTALDRARLQRFWEDVHDHTAITVVAPAGFGKTTLLLQWRRRWLERGTRVAWLTADDQDDPVRFTNAVQHAVREAGGRRSSDATHETGTTDIEALTALLGEIALQRFETVLVLDDADRLPKATLRSSVQYMLLNAPANLHAVFASRLPLRLPLAEIAGDCAKLTTGSLRLHLEESIELLERRLPQLGMDERAQLHELTDGWPLGLQLAIAAIEHAPDPATALQSLSARHGAIHDYFVESLLKRLPQALADFLVRIAILDPMTAELCAAVTGEEDAAGLLARLAAETPVLTFGELDDWIRLHPLTRDFLLARFEQLPPAEQAALHARAARWFSDHGDLHEAAGHALAAGDRALAQTHSARSLWTLGVSGRYAEAREALDHIPPKMLAADLNLRLAAAAILALSDRSATALEIAREAIDDPATEPRSLAIALRVAAGASAYADRIGQIPGFVARWPDADASGGAPLHAVSRLNSGALAALHAGASGEVRERIAEAARLGSDGSLRLAAAFGQMLVGLSHLWDGNACRAEAVMRAALARAERDGIRRDMVASLHASVLAAALFERDQAAAAQALLANRLDVIERCGFPDNVLLAYRTLAYIALGNGDERRALDVLASLDAIASRRRLPRLRAHALAEQIRIHALAGRNETVARLLATQEQLAVTFEHDDMRPFMPQYELMVATSRAYASLAAQDLDEAERQLEKADALATRLHRGRAGLAAKVLRAIVARLRGNEQALPLLKEAIGLAEINCCTRLLADTHPLAVAMATELQPSDDDPPREVAATPIRATPMRYGLLTTKEAEILALIEKGMPNKQIARTLDISAETVKWHLKNLYMKLSAGTRRHAVERARLLGLVG